MLFLFPERKPWEFLFTNGYTNKLMFFSLRFFWGYLRRENFQGGPRQTTQRLFLRLSSKELHEKFVKVRFLGDGGKF